MRSLKVVKRVGFSLGILETIITIFR